MEWLILYAATPGRNNGVDLEAYSVEPAKAAALPLPNDG